MTEKEIRDNVRVTHDGQKVVFRVETDGQQHYWPCQIQHLKPEEVEAYLQASLCVFVRDVHDKLSAYKASASANEKLHSTKSRASRRGFERQEISVWMNRFDAEYIVRQISHNVDLDNKTFCGHPLYTTHDLPRGEVKVLVDLTV
jgi:hypothetical protein